VGEHDTYFIPVYTAGAGGVVAQLGTIAAVGAAFTGEYYVGLGDTQESAFEAYLQKLSGITPTASATSNGGGMVLDKDARIDAVLSIFEEKNVILTTPTSIQIPLSFSIGDIAFYSKADLEDTTTLITQLINEASGKRVLMWEEENILNFGYIKTVDGISELHYVAVEVGK
jgi:hypothetical protein